MDNIQIKKAVSKYYKAKLVIVFGLILSVFLMGLSTAIYSISDIRWIGNTAIVSYIVLIAFVITAAVFPIGKYNLKSKIKKDNLEQLLIYLSEFECGYNKYFSSISVIKRTIREITNDYVIMNRSKLNENDNVITTAWDRLNLFFIKTDIKLINRNDLKKYVEELLKQINEGKIDDSTLDEICRNRTEEPLSRKAFFINWDSVVLYITTGVLIELLIFKMVLVFYPKIIDLDLLLFKFIYQTGSDIIATIFAIYTIKPKNKKYGQVDGII